MSASLSLKPDPSSCEKHKKRRDFQAYGYPEDSLLYFVSINLKCKGFAAEEMPIAHYDLYLSNILVTTIVDSVIRVTEICK